MGKHEIIEDARAPSGKAEASDASATEPQASKTPGAPSADAAAGNGAASKNEAGAVESATKTGAGQDEFGSRPGSLHPAADIDQPKPSRGKAGAEAEEVLPAPGEVRPRASRFTVLAAALALAAAVGAMAGALAAYGLARPAATAEATGRTGVEDIQALKENVVQTRTELAALKSSIESTSRTVAAQLTRIGERIDRGERAQAEPIAKLNKAIEALERLSRGEPASAGKDVTGAIPPLAGLAPQGGKAGGVEGWVVRDVHRGTALLEGRMGLIEVDPGDVVPGLGRVDAIRKQDGRWVVVTPRGLIMSPR